MSGDAFCSAALDAWLSAERVAGRLQGAVSLIQWRGRIVHARASGARNATGRPVTLDTRFWIASMTKPITSAAAMLLIEGGLLRLADPVGSYISGFGRRGVLTEGGASTRPLDREVSILDLMRHSAGVTYGQFGQDRIHRMYQASGLWNYATDNRDMAERLAALPLLHQPGTVFEYGMSTDLLGRVIEVVTGAPLDCALQELILGPLRMSRTEFLPPPDALAAIPDGPVRRGVAPPFDAGQHWCSGGAGLASTAMDYLRFASMLARQGRTRDQALLSRDSVRQMMRNWLPRRMGYGTYTPALGITAPGPENGLGFGLGLAVRTKPHASLPGTVGEFFWPGISGANFWVDPDRDLIAILLTHAPEHRLAHRIQFRQAVYAGLGVVPARHNALQTQ